MNKKIPLGTAIGVLIIVVAITFTATMGISWKLYNKTLSENTSLDTAMSKLDEVDQLVRQYMLGEIDEDELNDSIVAGYISGIGDKYAQYTSAELSESRNNSHNGLSTGIGISYAIDSKSGLPYVTMVHRGSSADTSGIKIGDYIIASSAGTADDIGVDEMLKALEGSSGDTKSLTVKRGNEQLNFVCTVSQFEITSVTYSVEENIGIVKISAFNTLTVSQFKDAIAELTSQEITGIIFDVRHNSGGVMSAAKDILDIILPEGTLYTAEYSDGTAETFTSDAACIDLPMAVLIDEKTASAAEMFAAAIKDYYAGALVGMKTYGKGVMQRTYSLSDDSMITITIAYFNSPKGINYDGVGIEPNFTVALSEEAADRFFILSYDEDIQLQTAVGLLNN